MLSKEDLLKNKEDLMRNIDELYEAYLDELYENYLRAEAEQTRLKAMNANLREMLSEKVAEITERDKTITALQAEISALRNHTQTFTFPQLQPEFYINIETEAPIGGIVRKMQSPR